MPSFDRAADGPLPLRGASSPSSRVVGSSPGCFAARTDIGGPRAFSSPDTPGMPAPSDKTAWDFMPEGWRERHGRWEPPPGFEPVTQLDCARLGLCTPEMTRVAEREGHLSPEQVRDEVAAGRMIVTANRLHREHRLDPIAIGRAARTKINANIGASPVSSGTDEELEKLDWAVRWGADTVMDLSTGGDVDACREAIVRHASVPIGTVPMYSMIIGRSIEELTEAMILEGIEHQARQGVDYFTIHAGVLRESLAAVDRRLVGIVSRGGSLLARWMQLHGRENPMYSAFDRICDILHRYDAAFSLGDGLRPGALADATDDAQLGELRTIATLTERAWRKGCQVMVEGPGHVPFDQIEYNMKLQRRLCHGAPFYVLGPLVADVFAGYDHITSAIGSTAAAFHGASMLCYVKLGCVAHKIAAHAADVALGIPSSRDWDDSVSQARAGLDWPRQFELCFDSETARALHDEDMSEARDYCAMCGHDWCAVRLSGEVRARHRATRGQAGQAPHEGEGHAPGPPACHSDVADAERARALVQQRG
jgi:phosphomethylpyrimidine synthase